MFMAGRVTHANQIINYLIIQISSYLVKPAFLPGDGPDPDRRGGFPLDRLRERGRDLTERRPPLRRNPGGARRGTKSGATRLLEALSAVSWQVRAASGIKRRTQMHALLTLYSALGPVDRAGRFPDTVTRGDLSRRGVGSQTNYLVI